VSGYIYVEHQNLTASIVSDREIADNIIMSLYLLSRPK
jgi:hypothetical protein